MRTILFVLLALMMTVPVYADDVQDGFDASMRGDYKTAFEKWKPLAEQGYASAQYNLGVMYDNGQGVAQDYIQAHMWFNIAGANGYEDGRKNRDIIEKRMTPDQIAEAQKLAREWMEKHNK